MFSFILLSWGEICHITFVSLSQSWRRCGILINPTFAGIDIYTDLLACRSSAQLYSSLSWRSIAKRSTVMFVVLPFLSTDSSPFWGVTEGSSELELGTPDLPLCFFLPHWSRALGRSLNSNWLPETSQSRCWDLNGQKYFSKGAEQLGLDWNEQLLMPVSGKEVTFV